RGLDRAYSRRRRAGDRGHFSGSRRRHRARLRTFTQSEPSKTAGRAYLDRLKLRADTPDAPVSKQAVLAELAAIGEWGVIPKTDSFAVLGQIHHPTLIVH